MSVLSDDTDVLLLIPPDFFLVPSDSDSDIVNFTKTSEKLVVSDLISQVNDLEGRICMIENQNAMPVNGNLQQMRHFGSADALNMSYRSSYNSRSLQTTPMKTSTLPSPCKNWKSSLRSPISSRRKESQNMLTSHQYVYQKEKDDQLLKEIHNFFKQKNQVCDEEGKSEKNFEEKSISEVIDGERVQLSTAVFNLNKVNDLLKQLEETQAEIEQKLKLKGLSGPESEENSSLDLLDNNLKNFRVTDILKSETLQEGKSPRRFLNFTDMSPRKSSVESKTDENTRSNASENMQLDVHDPSPKIEESSQTESQTPANEITNLLSLCNLWGSGKKIDEGALDDQKVLKQRYLEEKCRRQHCEELIHKLQLRLLEEQQKIAVAMKVDKEKDDAIQKLTEGWNKLVGHWKELENQRNTLAKKLQSEREKFQTEVSGACQTVKRYEDELSKALDLAHGYKEKCELSEKEKKNMTISANKQIDTLKTELQSISEKFQKELSQIEKLEKLIAAKDESLTQAKTKIFETQNQIRELKKNLKDQQTEMEILKHDKEKLGEKLKEEKNRVLTLEQSKKTLQQSNDELRRKEKSLKENAKAMTEQMEKVKVDLKEFYQEQVEKIVQEKLKEFQEQLATAEKSLQNEIEERERKVTEMAVKQVQQIVEKHVVEVSLLEEKHSEEIELWKIKLMQAEEKVKELQKKLEHYSSHKTEIAQKLQTVMETQWQEALKIITASSPHHQKSPPDSDRSNLEKGLTRQNTFTMLSSGWGEGELNKCLPTETESVSESLPTETPFCKDGQLTYRENDHKLCYRIDETPQKMEAGMSDPLKKYIKMLLERPPGLPVDDSIDKSIDSTLLNLTDGSSLLRWQNILSERSSQANSDTMKHSKEKDNNKIPWK